MDRDSSGSPAGGQAASPARTGAEPEAAAVRSAGAPDDTPRLVVGTYNLGAGLADPVRLSEGLRAAGVDLAGLQEVGPEQAGALAAALADALPHRLLVPLGIPGKGVLSRYPLLETELLPFFPSRPDLRAVVDAPGGAITVLVAHPPPPRLGRAWRENAAATAQIARLADLAARAGPVVLLCDLNRLGWQAAGRRLAAAGLLDAFATAGRGRGATHPIRPETGAAGGGRHLPLPPLVRIDYVWHSAHFSTEAAWLGPAAGSDHRPVLARLARHHLGLGL